VTGYSQNWWFNTIKVALV